MSKVIFKLKFQHPNKPKTKSNNFYHMIYIATREGVALNDDLEEINKVESNNKDYLKYIANRPRSHGLFGNYKKIDLTKIGEELKKYNGYVYRGIVSLREEDAVKLGYDKKENWETLIREKIYMIAKLSGIEYRNLKWVAAFHREQGHPHVHIMYWDKTNPIKQQGAVKKDNIETIRKSLVNTVFKQEREEILIQKNGLRYLNIERGKNILGLESGTKESIDKLKDIDLDLYSEAEEFNYLEIGKKIRNELMKEIKNDIILLKVPKEGRLQYKLMPEEVKKEINNITEKILNNPSNFIYYDKYMKSVKAYTSLYTNDKSSLNAAKNNAKDDLYNRIGNNILKVKKEYLKEDYINDMHKMKVTQDLIIDTIKSLTRKTNQNENNKTRLKSMTKQQRKEYAKKMKATGIYSRNDLSNDM